MHILLCRKILLCNKSCQEFYLFLTKNLMNHIIKIIFLLNFYIFSEYKYDPIKLHHLSKANAANLLKRKSGQTPTESETLPEVNKQLTGSATADRKCNS